MLKKLKPYIVNIAIALAVGGLSALLTRAGMDFYEEITKPRLSPPSWLFPVVWTILFVLMGISAGRIFVLRDENPAVAESALKTYYVSLGVNFLWSIIFFNLKWFLFAFLWLCFLWVLILMTILKYKKLSPLAAYLQVPYLLWVTFAGYLNFMIYTMN